MLLFPAAAAAQEPQGHLRGIQVQATGQGTQVLLTTTGLQAVRAFRLSGPARVVVDLSGLDHDLERTDFAGVRGSGIARIRSSQFDETTVRVVLDLERAVAHRLEREGDAVVVHLDTGPVRFAAWTVGVVDATTPLPPAPDPAPSAAARAASPVVEPHAVSARVPDATPAPETRQDVVVTTVTRIAGSTLYVDRGTESGLMADDTLALLAVDDAEQGGRRLHVLAAAEARAVLEFVGAPVQVTRGDRVRLSHEGQGRPAETLIDVYARAFPEGAAPAAATEVDATRSARASGRLLVDLNAVQSSTHWSDSTESGTVSRTFVTPTARLMGTVTDLPGGLRLQANLRGSYRHASGGIALANQRSLRVYELSLDRETERLQVRLGRFYSPYESFSGYWDGGVIRVGGRELGGGVLVGFQPDAWNEGFSTQLPKVSAFVDLERRTEGSGFRADGSIHRLMPREGQAAHTFLGWSQRLWWSRLTVSNDLQVDQDVNDGGWRLTELQANATLRVRTATQLYARLTRRQPYYYWLPGDPFSYLRDGAGVGASVALGGAVVGADASVNRSDVRGTSHALSGSVQLRGPGAWSTNTYLTWWSDGLGTGTTLSPTLSRSLGDVDARFGYRFYRTDSAFNRLTTHGVDGSVTFPLREGLRASVQGSGQWGGNLRNLRLYSSLWKTF
ncbi:MAG: AMIN domain-containing protein [Gemmatimonadetes bacterium]|nr:AMIN domain-containing protein [Gemmatimonadota bacterium]